MILLSYYKKIFHVTNNMNILKINNSEFTDNIASCFEPLFLFLYTLPILSTLPNRYDQTDIVSETTQNENLKNKIHRIFFDHNFQIVNETTKEKILLNNVSFSSDTEMLILTNENPQLVPLESVVRAIIKKFNWNTNTDIIIASSDLYSFSYGVEYYCVKNISGAVVDICIKSENNNYKPIDTNKNKEYSIYDYSTLECEITI